MALKIFWDSTANVLEPVKRSSCINLSYQYFDVTVIQFESSILELNHIFWNWLLHIFWFHENVISISGIENVLHILIRINHKMRKLNLYLFHENLSSYFEARYESFSTHASEYLQICSRHFCIFLDQLHESSLLSSNPPTSA